MFLEIDQVVVNKSDWDLVVSGDASAKDRLKSMLKGLITYDHAFPFDEKNEIVVFIRDLRKHDLIDCVELSPTDHTPAAIIADAIEERGRLYWEEVGKIADSARDYYMANHYMHFSLTSFLGEACTAYSNEAFKDPFAAFIVLNHSKHSINGVTERSLFKGADFPWQRLAARAFHDDCLNEATKRCLKALSKE